MRRGPAGSRRRPKAPQAGPERVEPLARALFDAHGARRLPTQGALDRALAGLTAEELFWWCETRPTGPLYLLPTRELTRSLAAALQKLAGPRGTVLEIAAGDGALSRALREAAPELRLTATDSGAWARRGARLSRKERKAHGHAVSGLALGADVERAEAVAAIRAHAPDVVLAAWLPPGPLLGRAIRAPCRYVLELGAGDGVTAEGEWDWRYAHDFRFPAVEARARCRLDAGGARHSQVTLYFGARHPEFAVERPRPGDWLSQFKPTGGPKTKQTSQRHRPGNRSSRA